MGSDITDVKSFMEAVASRTQLVKLYEVPSQQTLKSRISGQIPKLSQISNVHQVTWTQEDPKIIFIRELSCFECPLNMVCVHSSLKKGWVTFEERTEIQNTFIPNNHDEPCNLPHTNIVSSNVNYYQRIADFKAGEWVQLRYDGSMYPGQILDINQSERELTINAMEPLPKNENIFKWPKLKDIYTYPLQDVVKKIGSPVSLNKRGVTFKFLNL